MKRGSPLLGENLIGGLAGVPTGGIPSPPVQGATVLHCLARLYEMAIQGATKGATSATQGATFLKIQNRNGDFGDSTSNSSLITGGVDSRNTT